MLLIIVIKTRRALLKKNKEMNYIVSLGGSLIAPNQIDTQYLRLFRSLILQEITKGHRFLIIPGGGQTCRTYQKAASKTARVSNDALDQIGIAANRLHSYLLHAVFGKAAYPRVLEFSDKMPNFSKPVIITVGGIAPGGSSDTTSVKFAKKFGIKNIVNLTNVAGVFDQGPEKFKKAKLISRMTWQDFIKQFGTARKPGQHLPFDPSIARLAHRLGIKVAILNGRDIKNLSSFLQGKRFMGTVIE